MADWQPDSNDSSGISMMVDQDYMEFMSDTLFSTISSNQPFAFPDTRDIGKTSPHTQLSKLLFFFTFKVVLHT